MKIEVSEIKNEIDEGFYGLLIDDVESLWLVARDGAVCFGHKDDLNNGEPALVYDRAEWRRAIKNQGHFTRFNGKITLEN